MNNLHQYNKELQQKHLKILRNQDKICNREQNLIKRQKKYKLEKDIIVLDSEDRDKTQFPNPNHYILTILEDLKNVIALRLLKTEYLLKDGGIIQGITEAGGDPAIVMSQGGMSQIIPRSKVQKVTNMKRSLMLSAEQLGLDAQQVADIVAYMKEWN